MTWGMLFYQDIFFYIYLILAWFYYRPLFLPTVTVAILFNLLAIWRIRRRRR